MHDLISSFSFLVNSYIIHVFTIEWKIKFNAFLIRKIKINPHNTEDYYIHILLKFNHFI